MSEKELRNISRRAYFACVLAIVASLVFAGLGFIPMGSGAVILCVIIGAGFAAHSGHVSLGVAVDLRDAANADKITEELRRINAKANVGRSRRVRYALAEQIVRQTAKSSCDCQKTVPDVISNAHVRSCVVGQSQAALGEKVTWIRQYAGGAIKE